MPFLQILTGSMAKQEFELGPDPIIIGRTKGEIKLPDQGVSSQHAKLTCQDDVYFLMDMGSTNGTLVNGQDIDREQLNDGDEIEFGPIKARFSESSMKASKRAAAPAPRAKPPPPAPPARPVAAPPKKDAGVVATQMANVNELDLAPPPPPPPPSPAARTMAPQARPPPAAPAYAGELNIEMETLKGQVAFYQEENRKLQAKVKDTEVRIAQETAASLRAEMNKLRDLIQERDKQLKELEKQMGEFNTYYSPQEFEREKKRLEAGVETEHRRGTETLERQVKDLEHRIAVRGAEGESVTRALKEKDQLIEMLSLREDEVQADVKKRDEKIAEREAELKKAKEDLTQAAAKLKEAEDKVKLKNNQMADLGKKNAEMVQELAKVRATVARVAGSGAGVPPEIAAAAAEAEQREKATNDSLASTRAELQKLQEEMQGFKSAKESAEAQVVEAKTSLEAREKELTEVRAEKAKAEEQLSDVLKKSNEMTALQGAVAKLRADRDEYQKDRDGLAERVKTQDQQLAELTDKYEDLVHEHDQAARKVETMSTDLAHAQQDVSADKDWEARYRSALEESVVLKGKIKALSAEVQAAKENVGVAVASAGDGKGSEVGRIATKIYQEVAGDMLDLINTSVSSLRRNAQVMRGYVDDCGLLANVIGKLDYTNLEPEQQRMLVELKEETQPAQVVKNMQSMDDENRDNVEKAKKFILEYQEAFKVDEGEPTGADLERAFAKAMGLLGSVDKSMADVPFKSEAALPPIKAEHAEAVLFAYSLIKEVHKLALEGEAQTISADTDGMSISLLAGPLAPEAMARFKAKADPHTMYVTLFAQQLCNGKIDLRDDGGKAYLSVQLQSALG